MVKRVYVEKKPGLRLDALALQKELQDVLAIKELKAVRIINYYDLEGLAPNVYTRIIPAILSEPPVDDVYEQLPSEADQLFAVEYLPGQFDQRADSAAQCIQLSTGEARPTVRSGKVYLLFGTLTEEQLDAIKRYVINPVEAREASLSLPESLVDNRVNTEPVPVIEGFLDWDTEACMHALKQYGLAMDLADLQFCQSYFKTEGRNPSLTELRVIDTYWSDHCRHTTFSTVLTDVSFEDAYIQKTYEDYLQVRHELNRKKPVTLMDLATINARMLKAEGKLTRLDESEEINACTVKIDVNVDGKQEPWLLSFKNETHNHPTEIEPFGGAATCIGGAIRDPLAARAYVYGAMRLSGCGDPTVPLNETLPGKLPQRKLAVTSAAGYSSYGNQIGLATGIVEEIYHEGYRAKHMEVGAVIAASPESHVVRLTPAKGDVVILLGGRTGRDGCGGATGSSKAHTEESLSTSGAEVQKGNAPEERKLQRLFRNGEATKLIKRCNDFGAGGVAVAIGELADGLEIDLNKVPLKYADLNGTELAISESQERMAVVVAPADVEAFLALAEQENLQATPVATVTDQARMVMQFNNQIIVDLSRAFLSSNGASKEMKAHVAKAKTYQNPLPSSLTEGCNALCNRLAMAMKRGLAERFDSTIGAGTVLMPFGGKYQRTPIQAMVHQIPLEHGDTDSCSFMSWGYDPNVASASPYHGAYLAVVDSVSKLLATGASFRNIYLSLQEYFPRLYEDATRWGMPLAALLGAFAAQKELQIAAIGGKDSMSGSFEELDVPPTLISFAVTDGVTTQVRSNEMKQAGHQLILLKPDYDENGLPKTASLLKVYAQVEELLQSKQAVSAYAIGACGVIEALLKMSFGNKLGLSLEETVTLDDLFSLCYGGFVLETVQDVHTGTLLGEIIEKQELLYRQETVDLSALLRQCEARLEAVYPTQTKESAISAIQLQGETVTHCLSDKRQATRPLVLIPVFPGTNCEYDSAKAFEKAGAEAKIFVIRNQSAEAIKDSVEEFANLLEQARMILIPGGFSGGDEPDGSGKFITAFFRHASISEATMRLITERDGLICGICNGFQALIKLGLVPYGKIVEPRAEDATLTYNTIGRHQSRLIRTRIVTNRSPWLAYTKPNEVYTTAISHGEGRFIASEALLQQLADNNQIATQYCDYDGKASMDIEHNPNGSIWAVEGITSPDGRVFGKMGHTERIGNNLYQNVAGNYDLRMFQAAVDYLK